MTNPDEYSRAPEPKWAGAPTQVRYLVVGLCVLMSILLYIDRFALTPITTTILHELNLDEEQFGRAVGAFFLVYALCQVPAGLLSDFLGARWTLALYVVGWSLATIGLGFAGSLIAVTSMRMVLGATQAGAYPAAASLLKRWIPAAGRARANTVVSMGGRAGNLLAQFLTPLLALAVASQLGWQSGAWRVVLALYGAVGLVWAVAFVWLYRDKPDDHPWCNEAERKLIEEERRIAHPSQKQAAEPGVDVPRATATPFALAVLLSPEVWLLCIMGVAVNVGWVFLVTWLPRFLLARHGPELSAYVKNTEVLAGMLTALTGLGGILGSIVGGAAADGFVARYGLRWGRRLPGLTAGFVVMGMYLTAMQLTSVWLLVALMFAISFTIDFGLGASWASYQDIGGRQVATVLAVGNMCGNLGAAGFGWLIGYLAKGDNWNAVFLIAGLSMALYASGWLLFDATRTVVREPHRAVR
jgi:MFS transporter, ACS family, glucarate transporter